MPTFAHPPSLDSTHQLTRNISDNIHEQTGLGIKSGQINSKAVALEPPQLVQLYQPYIYTLNTGVRASLCISHFGGNHRSAMHCRCGTLGDVRNLAGPDGGLLAVSLPTA